MDVQLPFNYSLHFRKEFIHFPRTPAPLAAVGRPVRLVL
jgi:hypothetical protein